MKTHIFQSFLLGVFLLLTACSQAPQEQRSPIKRVIVIGIDGMSPDGIANSPTPVMDSVVQQGASTMTARGVLPTSSSPNWKSMISGSDTEQHGVTSNKWQKDNFVLPGATKGMDDIYPTIFGILRQQRPESKMGAIYDWKGFGRLVEQSALDYDSYKATGKEELTEDETADLAVNYIQSEKPDLLFVHFDHVDHAGHQHEHGSTKYYESVTKADTLIGKLLKASKAAGTYDETLFIISSDHGGVGKKHGGETLAEIEIPFMLLGPGVKQGYQIPHQVMTYDNAATVAYAFELETPYAWIGRPVKSAFED